jgi:hypothetical protein
MSPARPACRRGRRCRWGEDLVAGEDEEVAVERLHVDAHVGDGLRAVDEDAGAVAVGHLDHLRAGVMVPSAFETWVKETSLVRG